MIIGGVQKTSFIDYPSKIATVVFLAKCNLRCPYCHNPHLINGPFSEVISFPDLLLFLKKRRNQVDGVVISGGEPTLSGELAHLLYAIKNIDYPIKLDTNGTNPKLINQIIEGGLVDYIAMDIKADITTNPTDYYYFMDGRLDTGKQIAKSIDFIMSSSIDYEFRTTCITPFVNKIMIKNLTKIISGARRYFLQRFIHDNGLLQTKLKDNAIDLDSMIILKSIIEPEVQICSIR